MNNSGFKTVKTNSDQGIVKDMWTTPFQYFDSRSIVQPILEWLNSRHRSLIFSVRIQRNGKLPFVHTDIER